METKWTNLDRMTKRQCTLSRQQIEAMIGEGLYPSQIAARYGIPLNVIRARVGWKPGTFQKQCGRVKD